MGKLEQRQFSSILIGHPGGKTNSKGENSTKYPTYLANANSTTDLKELYGHLKLKHKKLTTKKGSTKVSSKVFCSYSIHHQDWFHSPFFARLWSTIKSIEFTSTYLFTDKECIEDLNVRFPVSLRDSRVSGLIKGNSICRFCHWDLSMLAANKMYNVSITFWSRNEKEKSPRSM